MLKNTLTIARKELAGLFASPTAPIFIGAFLAVSLFTFFWVETFFSRNLADVRPLFEWMPILLIFLMSAVTMRMWSEERRLGTLEYLMTMPVRTSQLVMGKFLACWALALTALAFTLPLPVSVSFMGPLDLGPVIGGYAAAAFLAAAYAAVGLYVSSKTDSQIVSLLVSAAAGAVLYVVGSDLLTAFVGNKGSELLKLFGTGARFESITRGVLDVRDIYYYASVTAVFLALNIYSLETLRWSRGAHRAQHRMASGHGDPVLRQLSRGERVAGAHRSASHRHDGREFLFHFRRHKECIGPTPRTPVDPGLFQQKNPPALGAVGSPNPGYLKRIPNSLGRAGESRVY
jgi:ABC-2 type transport system permease protein